MGSLKVIQGSTEQTNKMFTKKRNQDRLSYYLCIDTKIINYYILSLSRLIKIGLTDVEINMNKI